MKWLIIFLPLNLFGGWHSDWDALEDYVNGVTTAPPQFITTNLIHDLQQAMLERAAAVNVTSASITTLKTIGRFNVDNILYSGQSALRQIDFFLRVEGFRFAPDNWIDGGQPSDEMLQWCRFQTSEPFFADEFASCPDNTVSVTIPSTFKPHFTTSISPPYNTKWWTEATGYPDILALWRYEETNFSASATTQTNEHWAFIENPGFSGGLLGECIYTVTNVYTVGDVVHYQVGWKFTEHDSFDKLFRTNDWTGADELVRATLSVPTGTHPNVQFVVQGSALNTGDWFTRVYDLVREAYTPTFLSGRHRSAPNTTNTFTVGGEGVTHYELPVYMDLFDDGIVCENTVDTTNLASVAYLGSTLAVEWYGSKASYSRHLNLDHRDRGSMFANAHALVARKWALEAMSLTIHRATFEESTTLKYSTSGATSSYALAQATYAVYDTSLGGASPHINHSIVAVYNCETNWNIYGKSKSVVVLVDDLTDDLTAGTIYCIAADYTGPTLDTNNQSDKYDGYTNWENPTDGAAFRTYYTIATATGVGGVSYTFTIAPGAVSFPPTPGSSGDLYFQQGSKTTRGYRGEIVNRVLIDWNYEYE